MKRYSEYTLNGAVYKLRLTTGAQRKLIGTYSLPTMQILLDAVDDLDKMAVVMEAALSWPGSGNPETSGDDLIDLLVDEGYSGQGDFAKILLQLGVNSGVLDERMYQTLVRSLEDRLKLVYDGAPEAEPEAEAENPTN